MENVTEDIPVQLKPISTRLIKMGPSAQQKSTSTKSIKTVECRICLTTKEEDSSKQFITPCKCIGSVKHLHLQCFEKWMMRKCDDLSNRKKIMSEGLHCQICKQKFNLQFRKIRKCRDCAGLVQKMRRSLVLSLILVAFSCVSLALIFFLASNLNADMKMPDFQISSPSQFLLVIALLFSIISFFYSLHEIIVILLVERRTETVLIIQGEKQHIINIKADSDETSTQLSQQVEQSGMYQVEHSGIHIVRQN